MGCLTNTGDLLLGAGWLVAADWVRGVPAEVAVSLQGCSAAGKAGWAGGDSAGCGAGVSRWVAVRPGRGVAAFHNDHMEEGGVLGKAVMYLSLLNWVSSVCLHPL